MRFIKKTASVIASLIIILAIGGFVFVRNFDLNRYKSYIEDIVARETGRELKINGEAKLGISFVPTLVVNDVELANAAWAQNPQMIKLQKLEVKAAILPLLKRRIVIHKLILDNPEIYLETSANGDKNWMFTTVSKATSGKDAADKKDVNTSKDATPLLAAGLVAKQVELTNGIVAYYDGKTGKMTQVDIKEVSLEIPSQNELFTLNIDATAEGEEIVLDLQGDNLSSLLNEGKLSFEADAKAMGIMAEVRGAVEDALTSPRYALEGNIYNPAGNFNAPETTLEMQTDGTVDFADVVIRNLNVATNMIKGNLHVDWSQKVPFIYADLNTSLLDVNSLQSNSQLAFKLPSIIAEANALEMVPNDKIPYEYLLKANGELNLQAGKIVFGNPFDLSDVAVEAKLQNGILDIKKLNMNVGGGNIAATGSVNAKQQTIKVNLASDNLKLQDLHQPFATGQNGSVQIVAGGNLEVLVDLTSNGSTYRQLAENSQGQIIAILDKSEIKTGKLDWLASNIFTKIFQALRIDTNKNTNMDVACAVVRTDLKAGKAEFPSGIVFDGSKLKVISSGNINLRNDKIDFTIAPSLNKLADGNIAQALASFVKIEGTIENPKIGLDQEAALTTIVGTVASGGVYFGSEMLLNGNDSPCYTALQGTKFASKFPKPSGVKAATKGAYQDVNQGAKDAVKDLKNVAKDLLGNFSDSLRRRN